MSPGKPTCSSGTDRLLVLVSGSAVDLVCSAVDLPRVDHAQSISETLVLWFCTSTQQVTELLGESCKRRARQLITDILIIMPRYINRAVHSWA